MKQKLTIKSLSPAEGLISALLSILTMFSVLPYLAESWYQSWPSYGELITGVTTWSGYNKQADLLVVYTILLGLPVLFLCFSYLIKLSQKYLKADDKNILWIWGGYVLVAFLWMAQKPAALASTVIWIVLGISFVLATSKKKKDQFFEIVLAGFYVYLAIVALFMLGCFISAGLTLRWELVSIIAGCGGLVTLILLPLLSKSNSWIQRTKYLQLCMPFSVMGFVHFRYQYEKEQAMMELFYSGRWKLFCILLCVILFAIASLQLGKKNGEVCFSTFLTAAMLRVFMQPEGILSIDYFHNGEITLPMQQLMEFGKLPYRDLIPIHGFCDYYYGALTYLFFDGSYLSLNAAKIIGDLCMAVLLAAVVYFFVLDKKQSLFVVYLFMPFLVKTAGMRYLFLFSMFFVLFGGVLKDDFEKLYAWVLLSILAITWNASIGGAVALAFCPYILYRSIRYLPKRLKSYFSNPKHVICYVILVVLGLAYIPLFRQIVAYLGENTGTTLYVNGMEMLENLSQVSNYLIPGIVTAYDNFFLVAFGFLLSVLGVAYMALERRKSKLIGAWITLMIFFYVIANYAFVRFDEGLRSGVIGVFGLLLLAVTLGYEFKYWKIYAGFLMLAIWLGNINPMLDSETMGLVKEIPAERETVIMGKKVADPIVYVQAGQTGIAGMGTGFISANTLQNLQNIQTVLSQQLKEGETMLDLTNAVANEVLFRQEMLLPYTSGYNISNEKMQQAAIEQLQDKLPDMILLAPYIKFDDASLSYRSMLLYHYLLQQGYTPCKYENVIYMVKNENRVADSKEDELAFAQLMHKVQNGLLPAVWAQNFEKSSTYNYVQGEGEISLLQTEDANQLLAHSDALELSNIDFILLKVEKPIESIEAENEPNTDAEGQIEKQQKPKLSVVWESRLTEEPIKISFEARGEKFLVPVGLSPYWTNEDMTDFYIQLPEGEDLGKICCEAYQFK